MDSQPIFRQPMAISTTPPTTGFPFVVDHSPPFHHSTTQCMDHTTTFTTFLQSVDQCGPAFPRKYLFIPSGSPPTRLHCTPPPFCHHTSHYHWHSRGPRPCIDDSGVTFVTLLSLLTALFFFFTLPPLFISSWIFCLPAHHHCLFLNMWTMTDPYIHTNSYTPPPLCLHHHTFDSGVCEPYSVSQWSDWVGGW